MIVDVLNKYNVHGLPILFIPKQNTKAIENWLIEIVNEINTYVIDDVWGANMQTLPTPTFFCDVVIKKN